MASPENHFADDEPLTPTGRLFVNPLLNQIITCVLGADNPSSTLDVDELKTMMKNSILVKHPRFCSLMVTDKNGVEYWRRTPMDMDRHVIEIRNTEEEFTLNEYLADLAVSSPLALDKPLWELHLMYGHGCVVFRLHHALGDGISLMSMLLANCRKSSDPTALPELPSAGGGKRSFAKSGSGVSVLWVLLKVLVFSLVYMFDFLARALWVSDRKTALTGGAGVELWPRKMATARFLIEDMKIVKKAVAGATINDVLFGMISSGLSRYLDHRTPNTLKDGLRLTGAAMVNLREQQGLQEFEELMKSNVPGRKWGNKFGMILLPIYYHKVGNDPLQYVRRAKQMIDRKKQSLEAYLTYVIGDFVMSWFGAKYASILNYRVICNTTFTISNVVGPQEKITLNGSPVDYIRVNTSSLPHGLTMHMLSYEGKADMQIMVAKDIIPDPDFLAKCFQDSLLEMKEVAQVLLAGKSF